MEKKSIKSTNDKKEISRFIFGLCLIVFGLAVWMHIINKKDVADNLLKTKTDAL